MARDQRWPRGEGGPKRAKYDTCWKTDHQLLAYKVAASTWPRSDGRAEGRATAAQVLTTASITNSAGSSRRARLAQNWRNPSEPVASQLERSKSVIKYPERVKKMPTPSRPPGSHGSPRW